MSAGSWKTVVTTDARMKNRTKNGKERFRLNEDPFVFFSFRPLQSARIRVMGMMASVLVIFTMAALSSVLLPWIPSHAVAAAVTEEVSFTSPCPQTGRNHRCSVRVPRPEWGRSAAASTLKRKITEIDWATSSSEASMTGAVAAIALPAADGGAYAYEDRIVGFQLKCFIQDECDDEREVEIVARMMGSDCFPFARISVRFMPNPRNTTAAWSIFFDV